MNIKIISAGAGSGKTYRLTSEMVDFLSPKSDYKIRPSGIIATTFTNKAAAELQERVRVRLLSQGMTKAANDLSNALIGTVHGLGVKLLKRFAFEAGVSPEVAIIADEDQQVFFNQALAEVLNTEMILEMDTLSNRLGLTKKDNYDWRREVKFLTDIARNNAFEIETLQKSKEKSIESLLDFFPDKSSQTAEKFNSTIQSLLETTILEIRSNDDSTKKTQTAVNTMQSFLNDIKSKGYLNWHEWVKISKIDTGKGSKIAIEPIKDYATKVETHPDLHDDMSRFISNVFDISVSAINEYEEYKKRRGLIDYIDMEIHVNRLLDNPVVQEVMTEELDLLMVDEFQDTSPIQLEIFLKLSKFAQISVWVGDPKQSIYGFRGADPALMQAIIKELGGVKPKDIQPFSWRSREDIVHATNAIFVKAFPNIPADQVYLKPKREKKEDSIDLDLALMHWHFEYEGKGNRLPGKPWFENCIARNIREIIEQGKVISDRETNQPRPIQAGDIGILCRSNFECQTMAEALHHAGLKAAIARNGLMQTAEAKLVLACLNYILNDRDSLSIAEVLFLAEELDIENIIDNRIQFMDSDLHASRWGVELDSIKKLRDLRFEVSELSSSEILNLVLEEMDIRRKIVAWSNPEQRLSNIDQFSKLALQYEEACNRLHTAASLGGFLLWLAELEVNGIDAQGSGESSDAVNVLTYHKSKGLEWNLVICHSLEQKLKDNVWGIKIETESQVVDLDNLLGNRWIRYWINPYADQIRKTPLEVRIDESEAKSKARSEALQEEARLLYVGITRARDFLVIPSRKTHTRWLNRCWHNAESTPSLDPYSHETSWVWEGEVLHKETQVKFFPKIFEQIPSTTKNVEFFDHREGQKGHLDFHIDIDNEDFKDVIKYRAGSILDYQNMLNLHDEVDDYVAAKAIKAMIAVDNPQLTNDERLELSETFVVRFGEDTELLPPKIIAQTSIQFYKQLNHYFDIEKVIRKYPIKTYFQNRCFENVADIIIQTENEWLIIQNTSSRDYRKNWKKKVKDLYAWFYFAEEAVRTDFNLDKNTEVRSFLHFVLGGGMIEISTSEKKQRQLTLGI